MADRPLAAGKLPPTLLKELLGAIPDAPPELLLAPALGEDGCAIEVDGGVLIAATDPITLTGSGVGAHAVIINANDVAVMGARPRWFLAAVMLPVGTTEPEVRELFAGMQTQLSELNTTLVGGHTEITDAVNRPIVVGQMLGFREDGKFVRTGGAKAGDLVLQVGPAPVEAAAVLANEATERLKNVPAAILDPARRALSEPGISVVSPALLAAELGATAMHDPTEGGLSTGLYELASASGVALRGLDAEQVLWFEPGVALCRALEADPWGTLASGCLLASFPAEIAESGRKALEAAGHPVAVIAAATSGAGVWLSSGEALARFDRDELSRVLTQENADK